MPRNVDPGTIRVGKGLAPEGTVEDNSLRYPERDADPLRVHIHDPSRAHMASAIGIVDEADCYVSDEVEGALQELCASSGAGRLNGMIAGGTFSELSCAPNGSAGGVHATLTLCAPTEIFMNGSVFDASGLTVPLTVNAVNFIYLDTHPPSPTYRELVSAASPPEVEVGIPNATTGPDSIEHVMLAKVTVNGAGNVDAWQDARFFVRNLDRKVQYSSRQGENVDAWSEGCFANLQAFFFWAEYYGDGFLPTSDEEEKGTVLLRGTHSITAPLVVPTDHLQFVGDGDAIIELNGIAAPFYGLTFNDKSHLTFRNLTFHANLGGCMGIVGGGNYSDITIEDCRFAEGTTKFHTGISLTGGAGNARLLVRDCYMETTHIGVEVDGFGSVTGFGAKIQDCVVVGVAAGTAGSMGVAAGSNGTVNADLWITGCQISAMEKGLGITNTTRTVVSDCNLSEVGSGIAIAAGTSNATKISDCTIVLTDNAAISQDGIHIDGGNKGIGIFNNYIKSLVAGGQSSEPFGIGIKASKGYEDSNPRIVGNTVLGFFDNAISHGHGIACWGTDGQGVGGTVTGNILVRCDISVFYWEDMAISGNSINAGTLSGFTAGPTVGGAINVAGASGVTVQGNGINCEGVIPHGVEMRLSQYLTVTGNTIRFPVSTGILAAATDPAIAGAALMEDFTITGNVIDGFLTDQIPPTATGILVSASTDDGAPKRGVLDGNTLKRCSEGIILLGYTTGIPIETMTVSNNQIAEIGHSQDTQDDWVFSDAGSRGVGVLYGKHIHVTGNTFELIGVVFDDDGNVVPFPDNAYPRPIYSLNSDIVSIVDNTITGSTSKGSGKTKDIEFLTGSAGGPFASTQIKIEGNSIGTNDLVAANTHQPIRVLATDDNLDVSIRTVSVSGNTIYSQNGPAGEGFASGIIVMSGSRAIVSGVTIENNSIKCYLGQGISLMVGEAVAAGPSVLDTVQVRNNTMRSMNNTTSAPNVAGIYLWANTSDANDVMVHQVLIDGNTVETSWGQGICMDTAASSTGKLGLDDIAITSNTCDYLQFDHPMGACGIQWTLDGGTDESVVSNYPTWDQDGVCNVVIADNNFMRVPRSLHLLGVDCRRYSKFAIDNNRFHGTGSNHLSSEDYLCLIDLGISDSDNAIVAEFWSISGNHMEVDIGSSAREVNCFRLRTENTKHKVLQVQDNTMNAATGLTFGEHGKSFWFYSDCDVSIAADMADVLFEGNVFGGGLTVEGWTVSPRGIDILANQISIPILDDDTTASIPIFVTMNTLKSNNYHTERVSICNNSVAGGLYGILFNSMDIETIEGVVIDGNRVADPHTTGIAFWIDRQPLTGFFGDYCRNVKITDNTVTHFTGGDPGAILNGIAYRAGQCKTESLEVSRNQVYNAEERGILLALGGKASTPDGNFDRNIHVDDNVIDHSGRGDTGYPIIEVSADTTSALQQGDWIGPLSVSGNTISNCGNDSGITVVYTDLSAWGAGCTDVVVSRNVMTEDKATSFVPPVYGAGIEMDLPKTHRLQVSENIIDVTGFAGTGYGYGINLTWVGDCNLESVSISDNAIRADGVDVYAGIRLKTVQADFEIESVYITGNQIMSRDPEESYCGIFWVGDSAAGVYSGYFESVVIDNNSITNFNQGLRFEQCSSGFEQINMSMRNCSVSHNKVQDCNLRGLWWSNGALGGYGGNCHGLLVNSNSIITGYDTIWAPTSHPPAYMINVWLGRGPLSFGAKNNIHQISIDGNHCYFTSPVTDPSPLPSQWGGIWLATGFMNMIASPYTNTACSTVSINENHVRNCGTDSIRFEPQGLMNVNAQNEITAIGKVQQASVSNNIVRSGQVEPGYGLIRLELTWCVLRGFTMHGNNVRHDTDDNSAIGIKVDASGNAPAASCPDNSLNNRAWSVQGNIALAPSGGGACRADWTANILPINGSVMGNTNENCAIAANDFNGGNWLMNYNATLAIQSLNLVI